MALDKDIVDFIVGQNEDMEERLTDAIHGSAKGVRAKVESEVNRIDEMDKKRNDRIGKLEKQTTVPRWAHRNPKAAIIIIILFIVSVAYSMHRVNLDRTIEKYFRIELNENP